MPVDPSTLKLVTYPADVLTRKASPVPEISDEVLAVAEKMVEIMIEQRGIGLAAPQVGLAWRMFVVHVPEHPESGHLVEADPPSATPKPQVYINPTLVSTAGERVPLEEGCLSLPGIRGEVLRPEIATISALDEHGRPFSVTGRGLLARCWQHELDHLDGVLILSRMTQMARLRNRSAIRELESAR
jgi:peptide deformylase